MRRAQRVRATTSPRLSPHVWSLLPRTPQSYGSAINYHLQKFSLNGKSERWCFTGYKAGVTSTGFPAATGKRILFLALTLTFCTTFITSLYSLSFSYSSGACLNSDVQIRASVGVRHLNIYRYYSHFCERGQCLTISDRRAQCNGRLILATFPKCCCDTNHHHPGQTFLKLEEPLKKCLVEQGRLLLSQEITHQLLMWNCVLPFKLSMCNFPSAHVKNSKNLSSFHTTVHCKLVIQ